IVVTNTLESTLDLLERRSSRYSGRPRMPMLELMGWGWALTLLNYGDEWCAHRRLAVKWFDAQVIANTRNAHGLLRRLLASPSDGS
ncbi:hypothetical protein FIBSPDRAFT_749711, partial [Athelia psychrophila]